MMKRYLKQLTLTLKGSYLLAFYLAASYLLISTLLRLLLVIAFGAKAQANTLELLSALLVGLQRDLLVAFSLAFPMILLIAIARKSWFKSRWFRAFIVLALWLFFSLQIFLAAAEYFFFEEFESRFNKVAVDYLVYWHEVTQNIEQSYPLYPVLALCGSAGLACAIVLYRLGRHSLDQPPTTGQGWAFCLTWLIFLGLYKLTVPYKGVNISANRVVNELANNGQISWLAAAYTRRLDFPVFYKTIDRAEAYGIVRDLLNQQGLQLTPDPFSIHRTICGKPDLPKRNLVIIVEESFGSEFWGVLERKQESLTPHMDQLANTQGWLFTNLYAIGNRTVYGLQGILCGFPPLPGDSIVWRLDSPFVETMARVLKRDGYQTLFIYAGRGTFDRMDEFFRRNGFDRFIEQKDFISPVFTTAWGVSDEDLLGRTLQEIRFLHSTGKPFFVVALTISNHKPYTYPPGRIPEDPFKRKRAHAVKYADWALGQFFDEASKEPFWHDTLFVVVADHGARVYGSADIPIESYKIPLLLLGPTVVDRPRRFNMLGSQVDIPVTILSLLGRPYEITFFGRNLLRLSGQEGCAFMNHNRDIAIFGKNRMVVFGLKKSVKYYVENPSSGKLELTEQPDPIHKELEKQGIAVYQVADEVYSKGLYRIDDLASMSVP